MSRIRPLPRPQSDALVHDGGGIERLLEIMRRLRDPETGCPWDLEQDFRSIAPYTIEEAYEVAEAIGQGDMAALRDELGDLLLQVFYHARMAEEAGHFGFQDVVEAIAAKMLRRHPHVFGTESRGRTAAEQTRDWERLKAEERGAARAGSALDGVSLALPGLTRAVKLQDRAARVGFDWPGTDEVIGKIAEEAGELAAAAGTGDADATEDEFGDLLFVMANLGRHLRVDPEAALRRTIAKFERRFRAVEAGLAARGRTPAESDLAEMDALWTAIKRAEKAGGEVG